ncbi:MAG: hypothetical protein ABIP95_05475 [Pelobium sp.]
MRYPLKNKICLLVLLGIILVACNNPKVKEEEQALSDVISKSDDGGDNPCLLAYAEKYDELFTFDEAVKITGLAKADGEMEYNKVLHNVAYHDISYEWPSDRKRTVKAAGMEVEIPDKNQIEISGIEPQKLAYFKNAYSSKTEAELAEAKESVDKTLDEAYEGKSENERANKAMEKVKDMGQSKKDVKKVTDNLVGGTFSQIAKSYSPVDHLADAASWNSFEQCLYLLKNGVKVKITANLSADANYNKNKAIEIAKLILAKCN